MNKVGFKLDRTGQRYGRLVVTSYSHTTEKRKSMWNCQCDCGQPSLVMGNRLQAGKTTSCGCYAVEHTIEVSTTHNMSYTDEYRIYHGMLNRCYNKNVKTYPRYGGRGISVCDRWRFGENGISGVECFVADLGRRPFPKASIERRDNDGNYEPSNVKWGTPKEQGNNSSRNRVLVIRGEAMSMSSASEKYGAVSYGQIQARLNKGWSDEDAVFTPNMRKRAT